MAVEIKYIVVREGQEKMAFTSKKDADAYDKMPVVAEVVEREQPSHLREWFKERLGVHRATSVNLSRLPYEPKMK